MADKTIKQISAAERALAAWESAVSRTLNPHLAQKHADDIWAAVIANRSNPDPDKFQAAIDNVLDGAPSPIRAAADALVRNLRETLAGTKSKTTTTTAH